MGIKIIADSMCDVPRDYADKYDIRIAPLTVNFGDRTFKDGIDISNELFFEMLEDEAELPKTSQVTPLEFIKIFEEELLHNNELIVINGSSKMSGTYNSALIARTEIGSNKIHVIDSTFITMGGGMMVVKAAELASQGVPALEIVKIIEESKRRLKTFFIVDTLKYLHKGGRLSLTATIAGSILNIKPILNTVDGELNLFDKARGIKKAITTVIDTIHANNYDLNGKVIGINHSNAPKLVDLMEEMIAREFKVERVIKGEVGAVVGTYAGPGAVALYFEE